MLFVFNYSPSFTSPKNSPFFLFLFMFFNLNVMPWSRVNNRYFNQTLNIFINILLSNELVNVVFSIVIREPSIMPVYFSLIKWILFWTSSWRRKENFAEVAAHSPWVTRKRRPGDFRPTKESIIEQSIQFYIILIFFLVI